MIRLLVRAALVAATMASGAPALAVDVGLAPLDRWSAHDADFETNRAGAELRLTALFRPGGAVSPPVGCGEGEAFTLSAVVETTYESKSGYYLFWLELEFLSGDGVSRTVASSPLRGSAPQRTLAVTGVAPAGTTTVRAAIRAQNRISQVLPNRARIGSLRLERLPGRGGPGPLRAGSLAGLPAGPGRRVARLAVSADWPDGAALSLASTRGAVTPSVVLKGGRGEAELGYGAGDVGRAEVTATIDGRSTTITLDDPYAARLTIEAVEADGALSPALVQLVRDGEVLPGRYRSIPGEFVRAPWSMELAPGRYAVRISKGPQFESTVREVELASGREAALGRVDLRRAVDLRALGWYGGDPDGDVYHGQRIYTDVTAETANRVARSVGLDWVTPANWGAPDPRTWAEARAAMDALSSKDLLFRFADEKKWHTGHFCFVGLERPADEGFDAFWGKIKRVHPHEALLSLRRSGAATFANHPVRYWMSGVNNETFVTNMYAAMPFDLCAAGLLDGININEGGDAALRLWSLLLDHGYRVTATGGADFSLDHPGGWLPGLTRLYVHAPGGLSEPAVVDAIKGGRTVVSTGPLLVAAIDGDGPPGTVVDAGRRHRVTAKGWARHDRPDRLRRIELWAHGRAEQARDLDGTGAEAGFDWSPSAEHDWVSVRLVAEGGWAMTSAFYAAAPGYAPPNPVTSRVTVAVKGPGPEALAGAAVEVWDNWPDSPGAKVVRAVPLGAGGRAEADAPVTATIRVKLADGRSRDARLYDASGVRAIADSLSEGAEKDAPLLRWDTYDEVLKRCRDVAVEFSF